MNNTQSIIVYRSPYERDFYESGMVIPLFGALVAGFVVFVFLNIMLERLCPKYGMSHWHDVFIIVFSVVSVCVAVVVFQQLMF